VLSRYAGVPPESWRFRVGPHGKPETADVEQEWLRFSLSHTDGLAAVAVARDLDVGVDAEPLDQNPTDGLIRRCLSDAELERFTAGPTETAARRFLELWTLKEAYLKAIGRGLTVALSTVRFDLAVGEPVASFASEWNDDPHGWRFASTFPTDRHVVGVAARGPRAHTTIRFVEAEP
jgi:4'-phosphopantetheinyl transferase